jgi:hypothetical protein
VLIPAELDVLKDKKRNPLFLEKGVLFLVAIDKGVE